jgi:hypothetical protein
VPHHDFTNAHWIKSSRSTTQNECVELSRVAGLIGIRDSKKDNAGPVLEFTPTTLATFLTALTG